MNQPISENIEKLSNSAIAALSGICSSIALSPHLLFLLFLFTAKKPAPLGFLIPTYVVSIFLGEYLFWKIVDKRTPISNRLRSAFSWKNLGYFLCAYVSEVLIDIGLLFIAIQSNWNPLSFYLILLGCKLLSAPIQTYLSQIYLSKNTGFGLAIGVQVLCLFFAGENPDLLLYALILKGVFCNTIAIARSQYAGEVLA